ncbi:GntR family transcriptional regulator [Xanthobacter tagetidis]|nr:GntR family transcriptional regulator [Xanthobacter tagetidis]MBB6309565.1 DNA-binding GntR family transcriptional regulator [Xanthobacter tagetidis]
MTRTEELRLQIADDIVRGRLAPGTALEEVDIAKRYGVSRTPVREAIRDLAASGLVEARPHRSALVAQPSLERLRGMFDVMAELEALCAGLSAANMTPTERAHLQAIHAELADLTRRGDQGGYTVLNERFHTTLYAGAHNDYLSELTLATRARLQPFRRAQFRNLGRLALSYQEHDRVVSAILRGDKAEAATAMRAHINTVEVAYERYAESV